MTKTAFDRDNVLSPNDRLVSAQKCIVLLEPERDKMNDREATFVNDMLNRIRSFGQVSERQLAWLRDLVSKYAA